MITRTAQGAAGALFLILASGRAEAARDDSQVWTTANATVKLSDKWRLSQEFVGRFSDNRNGLYEIEAVTMLGYKPSKDITIAAGYVHNPQYSSGDFTASRQPWRSHRRLAIARPRPRTRTPRAAPASTR